MLTAYLNTDLVLVSDRDLTPLVEALTAAGLFALHVTHEARWHASFETNAEFTEPEWCIAAMLSVIESLDAPLRTIWDGCWQREFNLGYDAGTRPLGFGQWLSAELLQRMVMVRASIGITIYAAQADTTTSVEG